MWKDSIVEEVRKVREAHASKFKYDLHAIFDDFKKQEKRGKQKVVSFSAKKSTLRKKKKAS